MNRRTSIILLLAVTICACLYQESLAKKNIRDMFKQHSNPDEKPAHENEAGSDKWDPFKPYTAPKFAVPTVESTTEDEANAAKRDFFWNPLKFILRLIAIITYPPRFIIRFFFTFAAVFFLVLFNCQVIPEVKCAVPVAEMIPGIMKGLKEELDFYASLADDEE